MTPHVEILGQKRVDVRALRDRLRHGLAPAVARVS